MTEKLQQYIAPNIVDDGANREGVSGIFHALRSLMSRTRWMRAAHTYKLMSGADFGRNIQRELNALSDRGGSGVLAVSIRRKMKAIVITPEHYEDMRQMREKFNALVAAQAEVGVVDAWDHFDTLYLRIASAQSRAASADLFSASGEDLANSYRPGATETAQ